MPLLHPTPPDAPHLESLTPRAAIPGGTLTLVGERLLMPHTVSEEAQVPSCDVWGNRSFAGPGEGNSGSGAGNRQERLRRIWCCIAMASRRT